MNKNIEKYSPWAYFYIAMIFVIIATYMGLLGIIPILLAIFGIFYIAFQKIEWKKSTNAFLNKLKNEYENEISKWLSGNDYILPEIIIKSEKRNPHHTQSTYKEKNINKPINLNQILKDNNDFIIVGESGIGKTSLLYWIGLQLSERKIESKYIPLIISLKEISDKNTKEDFISLIGTRFDINNYNLSGKHILFLLDGLDQLTNYENVRNTLKHKDIFTAFDKKYKIIITTRLTGYEKVKSNLKGQYEYLEIQPFDNGKIKKYLGKKYYNDTKFQELFSINEELIKIPILLKLIKKLISENELNHIKSKADLYDKFIEYLLEKWQKNKDGSINADFKSIDIKKDLIDISYKSMENHQLGSVPFESTINYLNSDENKINRLISWCVTHDLVEKSEKSNFIYTHQSFQEYFASKKLKEEIFKNSQINNDLIKKKLEYFRWNEVWLFLVGSLEEKIAFKIISIIEKYDYKLAIRCLTEYKGSKKDFSKLINRMYFELNDPDIADLIVNISDEEIENKLIDLLKDKSFSNQENVAAILGRIATKNIVESLIDLLESEDPSVRTYASWALGYTGSEKGIEPLIKFMRENNNTKAGIPFRNALKQVESEEIHESIIDLLSDNNSYVKINAAGALGNIGSEKAIEPLIELLKDEDSDVRIWSINALGNIGSEKAIEPLIELLKYSTNENYQIGMALKSINSERSIKILSELLKSKDPFTFFNVAITLGYMGSENAVEPLIHFLQIIDPLNRGNIVTVLSYINSDKIIDPLIKLLEDDDSNVVISASYALGNIHSEEAVPSLIDLTKKDDFCCRDVAAFSLGTIGSEKAVVPLIGLLDDDIPLVRGNAAGALGRIGSEKAVDPLIKLLEDDDHDVCKYASQALWSIDSEKAVKPLIKLLRNGNYNTSYFAANALVELVRFLNFSQEDKFFICLTKLAKKEGKYHNEFIFLIEKMKKLTGRRYLQINYNF